MQSPNCIDSDHVVDPQPADYITDSLDLAAWIVCLGVSLKLIDVPHLSANPNPRFVFPNYRDLFGVLNDWENGQSVGISDLHTYLNVRRDLFRRAREEGQGALPPGWGE